MRAHAVYGPPGCGKTTELMSMINEFMQMGYKASDIAFLSHTKAAAAEALTRLNLVRSDKVSTIHSQCYQLLGLSSSQLVDFRRLNEFAAAIGVPIKNGSVESEEGIEVGDEYLGILNRARNRLVSPIEEYHDSSRPGSLPQFESFVTGYFEWKKANGFIDFTDMLERLVQRGEQIHFDVKVMLVDESQDLSALQWAVIEILCRHCDHMCIAGDDDQAIYIWGGADPSGMVAFEDRYDATRQILTQSHRIPASVHTVALRVIGQVEDRVEKPYAPRTEKGNVTRFGYVHSLDLAHGEDTLILCRAGAQKKEMEKHLIESKMPYLMEGGKPGLYQTKVAKAIRLYNSMRDGNAINAADLELLQSQAANKFRDDVRLRNFGDFLKAGHMRAINVPHWHADFYRDADLSVAPTIRVSSIHGSKGREADRVVIHTGLTERIAEGMDKDPDAEHRVFYVGVTRARHRLDILEGHNGYSL